MSTEAKALFNFVFYAGILAGVIYGFIASIITQNNLALIGFSGLLLVCICAGMTILMLLEAEQSRKRK